MHHTSAATSLKHGRMLSTLTIDKTLILSSTTQNRRRLRCCPTRTEGTNGYRQPKTKQRIIYSNAVQDRFVSECPSLVKDCHYLSTCHHAATPSSSTSSRTPLGSFNGPKPTNHCKGKDGFVCVGSKLNICYSLCFEFLTRIPTVWSAARGRK